MRTKLLIAGCVVLSVQCAAPRAHAENDDGWLTVIDCDDAVVKWQHLSDANAYRIELEVLNKRHRKGRAPIFVFDSEKGTLKIDGKLCGRDNRR
jgi:hypothetical protein